MEMPSTSRLHVYSRFQCFQSLAVKKGRNAMTGTEKRSRHVRRGRGREPKTFEPRKESKLMPMLPKRGCCEPMCGAVAAPDSSRCPAHARAEQRALEAGRPSTTERGYGGPRQGGGPVGFARDG